MFIMILNDGETYTSLEGCKLAWLSDNLDGDEIDEIVKAAGAGGGYDTEEVSVIRVFNAEPARADFYES